MIMKKHYSEITDDYLRAMNLPNTREVDTMQQRLQQVRRENIELRKEIKEIKSMLHAVAIAKAEPAARATSTRKKVVAKKATPKKRATVSKTKAGA
jgi:regulator of replication initiation timing